MHVERIYKDALLWKNIMVPELTNLFVITFLKTVKRRKIIKTIIHQKSENIFWVFFFSISISMHSGAAKILHAFFYKESLYKEPACRGPEKLKNLYY